MHTLSVGPLFNTKASCLAWGRAAIHLFPTGFWVMGVLQGLGFAVRLFAPRSQSQTSSSNDWTQMLNPKTWKSPPLYKGKCRTVYFDDLSHWLWWRTWILRWEKICPVWFRGPRQWVLYGFCVLLEVIAVALCSFIIKPFAFPRRFLGLLNCFKSKGVWDNRSFHLWIRRFAIRAWNVGGEIVLLLNHWPFEGTVFIHLSEITFSTKKSFRIWGLQGISKMLNSQGCL